MQEKFLDSDKKLFASEEGERSVAPLLWKNDVCVIIQTS